MQPPAADAAAAEDGAVSSDDGPGAGGIKSKNSTHKKRPKPAGNRAVGNDSLPPAKKAKKGAAEEVDDVAMSHE